MSCQPSSDAEAVAVECTTQCLLPCASSVGNCPIIFQGVYANPGAELLGFPILFQAAEPFFATEPEDSDIFECTAGDFVRSRVLPQHHRVLKITTIQIVVPTFERWSNPAVSQHGVFAGCLRTDSSCSTHGGMRRVKHRSVFMYRPSHMKPHARHRAL